MFSTAAVVIPVKKVNDVCMTGAVLVKHQICRAYTTASSSRTQDHRTRVRTPCAYIMSTWLLLRRCRLAFRNGTRAARCREICAVQSLVRTKGECNDTNFIRLNSRVDPCPVCMMALSAPGKRVFSRSTQQRDDAVLFCRNGTSGDLKPCRLFFCSGFGAPL